MKSYKGSIVTGLGVVASAQFVISEQENCVHMVVSTNDPYLKKYIKEITFVIADATATDFLKHITPTSVSSGKDCPSDCDGDES